MNHQWKKESLQDLVKYNRYLLLGTVALSILSLLLGIALINKEERWVLIPCDNIERRMEISNKSLQPSYLKEWAIQIARQVFITSPDEVVNQHAEIRKISASTKELGKFFSEQLQFVQGSRASSVFYAKGADPVPGGVRVRGTLHYWFAGSNEKIALEKSYIISYTETAKGLILLSNIEEEEKSVDPRVKTQ